jgi:hypothetical protein
MSAPSSQQGVDSRWPEALRRFASGDGLCFRSNGPHPYIWIAAPLAAVLLFCGIAAVSGLVEVTHGVVRVVASIVALTLGAAIATSIAYSFRGRLVLGRDGDSWVFVSQLGRWARRRTFRVSDVRHVETYNPGPDVIWPGSCGPQLRVYLRHQERPLALAAGLLLDAETLDALRQLLAPSE